MFAKLQKYHILNKLLALVAAVVFWFLIMSIINPDLEISFSDVKVTIKGTTELYNRMEYSILSDTNMEMDITLRGKRNVVLALEKSDIELICDVSQISGDGENRILCTVNTPDEDITVVNRSELIATVVVDKIIKKDLSVMVDTSGELAEGLRLGTMELSQPTVSVRGPTVELAGISHAVVNVDLTSISDTTTLTAPVTLVNDSGMVVETLSYSQLLNKSVDVSVPVMMVKELPLNVNINAGGGLTEQEVDVVVTPSKITVIGERSAVEEIEYLSLGMIDLAGIGDGTTTEKNFVLPSGVSCMSDRASATVMVTVKDITTQTYTLNSIQLLGSSEEYDLTLVDRTVDVRLRGNSSLLSTIQPSDFTAAIRLQDLEITSEGRLLAPVEITFNSSVNAALVEESHMVALNAKSILPPVEPVTEPEIDGGEVQPEPVSAD